MAGTGDEEMQDADGGESWKQVLDRKLHRLHSLFFGLEAAMERQHWEIALGLGLRLLGFLESQSATEEDRIYIHPIRKSVLHQIDIAKENHYKIIEKKALEHAGCGRTPTFGSNHPVDIAKIASSRFFKPFISQDRFGTSKNVTESVVSSKVTHTHMRARDDDASNIESSRRPSNRNAQASVRADRIRGRNIHKSLREENMETIRSEPEKRTPARRPPLHVLPSASGQPNDEEEPTKPPAFATAKRKWAVKRSAISEDDEEDAPRPRAGFNAKQKSVKYWTNKMETDEEEDAKPISFVTAKQKLAVDSVKRTGSLGSNSKTLGTVRRAVRGSFISPVRSASAANAEVPDSTMKCMELLAGPDGELPDKLRNLEPQLLEHISNEIMEKDSNVCWEDIAGLDHAKKCVTEMVIWPLIRPDLFHGCRSPGKGLLLFGPPGTGKTMIGKAIAGQAKATFFSISASSLTSKWIGEGEKLVRALFGVASCLQPAVIFIDEVDSLLSQRKSEGEHESSRRIKTQFLIEMEGIGSGNEQLLLIGATNRPQELDEAARRRFSKRLYIPLPSSEARGWIVRNLLQKDGLLALSSEEIEGICSFTKGYSGSDMKNLVKEASMFPLREALKAGTDISKISNEHMRPIVLEDFRGALQHVKPSVSKSELGAYEEWNLQFGSLS